MHRRRGMANQGFRSAQADRQFEYLKAIEESERVRLISFDVEGECRAGRTGLPLHQLLRGVVGPSASQRDFHAPTDSSLAAFLKPDLTPPERAVVQVEGWILGMRNTRSLSPACCDGVATGAVSLN